MHATYNLCLPILIRIYVPVPRQLARCIHTCDPMFRSLYFIFHTYPYLLSIHTYHAHTNVFSFVYAPPLPIFAFFNTVFIRTYSIHLNTYSSEHPRPEDLGEARIWGPNSWQVRGCGREDLARPRIWLRRWRFLHLSLQQDNFKFKRKIININKWKSNNIYMYMYLNHQYKPMNLKQNIHTCIYTIACPKVQSNKINKQSNNNNN